MTAAIVKEPDGSQRVLTLSAADLALLETQTFPVLKVVGFVPTPTPGPPEQFPECPAPTWHKRVGAACMVLAVGPAATGIATKLSLMHPARPGSDRQLFNMECGKRAADMLFDVLMAACEVLPPLSERIEQRLGVLLSSDAGLTERGDRSPSPAE